MRKTLSALLASTLLFSSSCSDDRSFAARASSTESRPVQIEVELRQMKVYPDGKILDNPVYSRDALRVDEHGDIVADYTTGNGKVSRPEVTGFNIKGFRKFGDFKDKVYDHRFIYEASPSEFSEDMPESHYRVVHDDGLYELQAFTNYPKASGTFKIACIAYAPGLFRWGKLLYIAGQEEPINLPFE